MQSINFAKLILLQAVAFGLVGISFSAEVHQEKPIYKPTGGEATLTGTISFVGTPPKPRRINTSADKVCAKVSPELLTDSVVVTDQKLANVVVYVRGDMLNSFSFDAPSPDVTLEHKGCRYVPHVLGMQTQQTLKVLNSDTTYHNTSPRPTKNREADLAQPAGYPGLVERFPVPELFIPFKDNQHYWEKAYVGVFSHPFFSVSATDGSYKISGLPPGQYTVVAWHEEFGEQTVDLLLAGSEQRDLNFTFNDAERIVGRKSPRVGRE